MATVQEIAFGMMDRAKRKTRARIDLKDIRSSLKEDGLKASKENFQAIENFINSKDGEYKLMLDEFQKCYMIEWVYDQEKILGRIEASHSNR